jgi:hypothetical protein
MFIILILTHKTLFTFSKTYKTLIATKLHLSSIKWIQMVGKQLVNQKVKN